MVEISHSGLRLTTPVASPVGTPVSLTLAYREEAVEIEGIVRWNKPVPLAEDDNAELASWEIGIAFTSIGEVSQDGLWRGLRVYREREE